MPGSSHLPDGTPHWLGMAEEATCAAALHCAAAEVRAQQLSGADFLLRGCGQVWDAILAASHERFEAVRSSEDVGSAGGSESELLDADVDGAPSILAVAARLPGDALPELQRWVGAWWSYCHPAGLRAHAALVRRESERRRRLLELSREAARVGRGGPLPPAPPRMLVEAPRVTVASSGATGRGVALRVRRGGVSIDFDECAGE